MEERKSRVKKFEELRKTLNEEASEKGILTKELTPFAKQLHQIDNEHFEDVDFKTEENYHSPLHMRNDRYSFTNETTNNSESVIDQEALLNDLDSEEISETDQQLNDDNSNPDIEINDENDEENDDLDSFNNQYLKEFIKEVKEYNVSKGYRSQEDTKSNLLNEVKSTRVLRPFGLGVNAEKEQQEIEELIGDIVQEDDEILETTAPLIEPKRNIDDTQKFEPIVENKDQEENIDETIKMRVHELAETEPTYQDMIDESDHAALLEETTQLKVQLEQQNDKVSQMSTKIESTNKILNITLTILIIVTITLLLIIGYNILKLNKVI